MSKKITAPKKSSFAIAACSFAIEPGKDIRLIPAGEFRALDGRPKEIPAWKMSAKIAERVIASLSNRANLLVIDYEHQTLYKEKNGQPAPAAGWFAGSKLEWREGSGLWATDVDWTSRAAAHIEDKEYKYISPVFAYDKNGEVQTILHAALTNNAALDDLGDIGVAAASLLLTDTPLQEALTMELEELLNNIRWMLNLPTLATAEEIAAELQKAVDKIKAGNTETAAAGFSLVGLIDARNTQIAALTNQEPDPAQYVPIAAMQAVQTELATLTAQVRGQEVDGLVTVALTDGKLLPAQEKWARDLGGKDITALTAYLETAQPVAALSATQTGSKTSISANSQQTTDSDLAVMKALGQTSEQFAAGKKEQ